ncbi:hypothetical protein GYMLUDRAFT_105842, partial [Collybiopsis luxurians FD-317 M1]
VDKKFSVNNRQKIDINTDLKAHRLVPMPKKTKGKSASSADANEADGDHNEEEDADNGAHDYIYK